MDKISVLILAISLIIIMFGMGLSLTLDDFKRIIKFPKAIIVGLTNQLVILPLIGYILTTSFDVSPSVAIGLMILAACPGGPTSNLIAHLSKGDTALSVSLTAISSVISTVTIPFIVNFALELHLNEGQIIQLPVIKTIAQIFIIVIIPVAIGMYVNKKNESFAERMEKPVRKLSTVVLVLVIMGIIIKERENMGEYFEQAGLISYSLNIISMLIGFLSAKALSLSKKQAISISIEAGIQNGTMAIMIATTLLGNTEYAVAPAIYSILMFFSGVLLILVSNKTKVPA